MSYDTLCNKCGCYYAAKSFNLRIERHDREEFLLNLCPFCVEIASDKIVKWIQGKEK